MSKELYFLIITFVLVLGLSGVVQADPCDANLIGWWKFDEGAGNAVEDSSAYDNNGVTVIATPTWAEGCPIDPCNSGMDFDGVSDFMVCAERDGNNPGTYPAELMPEKFTISCWTELDAFQYYGGFVSNGTEDDGVGFFLSSGGNGQDFGLSMGTLTGWWDVETPMNFEYDTERWYHVAATYDGQNAALYVDGELAAGPTDVSTIRWQADNNDYPSNFVIGSWIDTYYPGAGLPIDGIIDDVRFYNYAMPQDDIKVLAGITPGAATNPNPRYGAKEADMYTDLSWTPGADWARHDIYFGTDKAAVTDANIDVNFGVYMGRQDPNVFSNSSLVPALEMGKKYYWRIDEANETDDTLIKGRVWSFTVANYIIVDDMEAYVAGNKIDDTWLEWIDLPGSMAEIGLEKDIVHGGGQSMMFQYECTDEYGSWTEAEVADLPIPTSDWTTADVKALVLYFYGDSGNSATVNDKIYVALDDGSTIAASLYPDVNDIKDEWWHEWNIDLEDFNSAGVDLTSVSKMLIGFGGEQFTGQSGGGSGTVYFDDIRVWRQRCVPDVSYHYGDLTGDCFIDGYDVEEMSYEWLVHDYNVIATEPCDANLIGWWKFDEGAGDTVEDSSVYNNDGVTVDESPVWVEGYPNDPCDSAMSFNGILDYALCAERDGNNPGSYPAELMPDTFAVTCWVKLDGFTYYGGFVSNAIDGECGFYLHSAEELVGNFGAALMTENYGWMDLMTDSIYEAGTWYHLGFSYDGQYANLYVDGILVDGPLDVGGPIMWISEDSNSYPEKFTIGSFETGEDSYPAWGAIDEVRYYNYALSHGEVAHLAGLSGNIYVPLDVPPNLVPRVPAPAADPNYYPSNPDIVNFKDFDVLADSWLNEVLFP